MTAVFLWAGVLALGGCGAVLRTAVGATIDGRKRMPFPLGTFVVNMSGSFVVGLLFGVGVADDARLLASTALVGAYTTFSTWMADSEKLLRGGEVPTALLNVFGSLVLGLCAALLGKAIGELF